MERRDHRLVISALGLALVAGLAVPVGGVASGSPLALSGVGQPDGGGGGSGAGGGDSDGGESAEGDGSGDGSSASPASAEISFSFKEAPFDEVLDFFSRESGLPIIYEREVPQGAMTFLSEEPLSFQEAMTVLNLNLEMHNARLRREKNYLYLSNERDAFRKPALVQEGRVSEDTPPDRVVNLTIPLKNAQAEQVAEQVEPLLGENGMVTPVRAQNMVILIETAAQVRRIGDLIRAIDAEEPADSQYQLFNLEYAKAEEVVQALKGLIGRRQRTVVIDQEGERRVVEENRVEGVRMQPDARTNSVLVVGPDGRLETVEELIGLLDVPEGAEGEQQMMTFALRSLTPQDAAGHLRELYESVPADRRPTILPLAEVGKITVVGSGPLLARGRSLLGEVDPGADGGAEGAERLRRVARVLELEHLDPGSAERVARQMLSSRQRQVLRYTAAPNRNGLIVSGPPSDVESLERLLGRLDVERERSADVRLMRIESESPRDEIERVRELFRESAGEDEREPRVSFNAESRTLTLIGAPGALDRFEGLLREVQSSVVRKAERRTYDVSERDPSELAQKLPRLARALLEPGDGSAYRAPEFEALDELDQLVVRARSSQFEVIERLIGRLDSEREAGADVRLMRIDSPNAPQEIERTRELFRESAGEDEREPQISFSDETRTLTLIGDRASLDRFEGLLREVQSSVVRTAESRRYDVSERDPSELVRVLPKLARPLLDPGDGREYRAPEFEALDELDQLIVRAHGDQFETIERLIGELDVADPSDSEFRVLRVSRGALEAVAGRARALYEKKAGTRDAEGLGALSVEPDPASGSLLVSGSREAVRLYDRSVEQAQQLIPPQRTTRIIDIEHAEAQAIVEPLREMLSKADPIDESRSVPTPKLSVIGRTNSLVVTAEPAQHEVIGDFVSRLDKVERVDLPPFRLLQLRAADAESIASMLQQQYAKRAQSERAAMPVEVRADASTNTLIVSAHEDLFGEIKSFVEDLNEERREGPERTTVLFDLKVAEAGAVADAMNELYPEPPVPRDERGRPMPWRQEPKEVTVSAEESTNSLIIDAPANRIDSLEALAGKLDQVEVPSVAQLRTYRVTRADLDAVERTLRELADKGNLSKAPEAGGKPAPVTIETEPNSSTLIVAGDELTFQRVESVLDDLSAAPVEKELRIIPIANTEAARIRDRAVQIYESQTSENPDAGDVDVAVDGERNALEVVAAPEAMDRFMGVIEQLRKRVGPEREVRLIDLRIAEAEEAVEFVRGLLSSSGVFGTEGGAAPGLEAIPSTNTVLVSAPAGKLEIIEQLIRNMDREEAAETGPLRILKLGSTDATNIARVLQDRYDSRPPEQRARRPVSIEGDGSTNTLLVSAHAEVMPEIERIVQDLNDARSFDAEGREIAVYPLRHARAEELAQTIDTMFPTPPAPADSRPELGRAREVVVRADEATNSLIVDAPAKRLAGFEELVHSLDTTKVAEDVVLRTYRIDRAEPEAIRSTLRDLAGAGALGATGQTPVTVRVEPATRTLIVSGPEAIFTKVEEVLDRFEVRSDRPETAMRLYALEHARADRLQPLLERLLVARLKERRQDEDPTLEVESLLEVATDKASNTLIINAPESIQQIARQLIEQLDVEQAAMGNSVIRVVPLTYADARQVAETVNEAIPSMDLPGEDAVSVIPAASGGAVLLTGTEKDLAKVESLIEPLDERPSDERTQSVETFELEHGEASEVARKIQRLLEDQLRNEPWVIRQQMRYRGGELPERGSVRVEADERTNSLVVSAPEPTLDLARTIIERLDAPEDGGDRRIETFAPKRGSPEELVRMASRVLEARGGDGRDRVELIGQARSSSVVLVGPEQRVGEAMDLLERFDAESVALPALELRVIGVEHADVATVAGTVERMLRDRGRWPESLRRARRAGLPLAQPSVTAEPEASRLLVSAPTPLMPLAGELVSRLDSEPRGPSVEMRVYTLEEGDAASIAEALDTSLRAGLKPSAPEPTVTPEPRSNTLVVTAAPAQLEHADELVQTMDETVDTEGPGVRTIFLDHARAEAVAPLVERVLSQQSALDMIPDWARYNYLLNARRQGDEPEVGQQVRVVPEARLNALVVSAPRSMLELAERIVGELDVERDEGAERIVRVIAAVNADAQNLAENIGAVFEDEDGRAPAPAVRVDRQSNVLIVRATESQLERIESLVGEIDRASMAGSRQLRRIQVDRSRAEAGRMARTLKRMLERDGRVKVEVISADELMERSTPEPPQRSGGDEQSSTLMPGAGVPARPFGRAPAGPGTRPPEAVAGLAASWAVGVQPADSEDASGEASGTGSDEEQDEEETGESAEAPERNGDTPAGGESAEPRSSEPAPGGGQSDGKSGSAQSAPEKGEQPDKPTPTVTIGVDPETNALVVVGSARMTERVAELAGELERQMPGEPTSVRIVRLPDGFNPWRVANVVRSTVRQVGQASDENPGGFTGSVSATPDPAGNGVIVWANDTDFELVRELIGSLTRPEASDALTVKVYPLENASGAEAVRAIEELLSANQRGRQADLLRSLDLSVEGAGGETFGATVDPTKISVWTAPNETSLIVSGPDGAMGLIDGYVSLIDQSAVRDRLAIRQYELSHASAQEVAQTLQQLFNARRQGRASRDAPRARFVADQRSNTVLATASSRQHDEIQRLVEDADRKADTGEAHTRVFELERAQASSVRRALQQVVIGDDPADRERIRISSDDQSGRVVVRAPRAEVESIASLVEELDRAESAEFQTRVIELERARVSNLEETLDAMASQVQTDRQRQRGGTRSQIHIETNQRSNSVVLLGRGEVLDTVERIVRSLDTEPSEQTEKTIKAVTLERSDPQAIQRVIRESFSTPGWRSWWGRDPEAVQVELDRQRGMMILIGSRAQVEEAAGFIERLEQAGDESDRRVRTIRLEHAQAGRAASSINRFLGDRARAEGRPERDATVIGSPEGNVLIVSAGQEAMSLIEGLIEDIDQPELGGDRTVEVRVLSNADPREVARTVQQMFPERRREDRVIVTPQQNSNSVVVSAPGDAMEDVTRLLDRLDKPVSAEDVTFKTIALESASASEVARSLERSLPENVNVRITTVRRSNSLLLTGSPESIEVVEEQIGQLDTEPARSLSKFERFRLEHAMAEDVWLTLREMLRNRQRPNEPEPSIDYSSRDNTLSVSATSDQLDRIRSIIEELDVPKSTDRATEFIKLEHADAEQTASALKMFYGRMAPEASTPGEQRVTIVPDPASNSLVISAGESEWEGIRSLLEKLDTPAYDTSRQLVVLPLKHADARSVADALSEGFQSRVDRQLQRERMRMEQQRRQREEGRDPFLPEPRVLVETEETPNVAAESMTNSLIVFASRRNLERIRSVVERLDVPEVLKLPEARVIPVERGRASELARSVREMFQNRSGGEGDPRGVRIVGDDTSGTLIVRAEESEFQQIRSLAESIQQRVDESRASPRVVRVANMPAARLRETLLATFRPLAEREGQALSIEVDRGRNALVLAAPQRLFEEMKAIIEALDTPPEWMDQGGGDGSGSDGGQAAVPTALGQRMLILDVESSSPRAIAGLLEQMGVTAPQSGDRAALVAEPVRVVPLASRQAVAVLASPGDAEAIRRVVSALDEAPEEARQHVEVVPLRLADARELVSTLERMLSAGSSASDAGPAASLAEHVRRLTISQSEWDRADLEVDLSKPVRLVPDEQTNAVVIASTEANVRALSAVVGALDKLPVGEAVTVRIFPLENAAAERVRAVIEELFSQGEAVRRLPGTERTGLPSTMAGKALAGEIAASVDERTNALIVAGPEEAVALAEVLINDLDDEQIGEWVEPRIIPLEHADPVRLAEKLRRVLIEGLGEAPEASGLQRQVARLRMAERSGDPFDPQREKIESDLLAPMNELSITPEENLEALIVVGSEKNTRIVEQLAGTLDVEAAAAGNEVAVYPLDHASADRIAETLRGVFREREQAGEIRAEDRLIVSADLRTNSLVVSTSPRSRAVLEKLLETLDTEEANRAVDVRVVAVPDADVEALAPKIQRLMRERIEAGRRSGVPESPSDAFVIEPEPATQSLIVAASEENFGIVEELIDALKRGEAGASGSDQTELLTLEEGSAREIAEAVRDLYADAENERRGDGTVRIVPDERLNALIVTGARRDIREIRDIVGRLTSAEVRTSQDIRRFELESANSLEIVNLLETILAGQPIGGGQGVVAREQATRLRFIRKEMARDLEEQFGRQPVEAEIDGAIRDRVRMTPDLRTNSVLVSAPTQMLRLIEQIILDLDRTSAGDRHVRVFQLENADAQSMRELLIDLFQPREQETVLLPRREQGPPAPGEREGDAPADREPGPGSEASGGTGALSGAFGRTSLTRVPDERRQLSITVDPRTNALLVSGTEEQLSLVEEVVGNLDTVEGTQRERAVYHLRNAQASDVQQTLREYFEDEASLIRETLRSDQLGSLTRQLEQEVVIVGDQQSNKLVISASPRYIETVTQIVRELDAAPPQVVIQVLLAEVTVDSSETWGMDFDVGPFGGDDYRVGSSPAGTAIATAIGVPSLAVSSGDFDVMIRSLQSSGRLEVLSKPVVTVNNNENASIQVGEDIAIIESVDTFENRTQANVIRRDIGIILDVTPSISADGFVRMEIQPEISDVSSRSTQISENFESPIITQRRVDTTVTLKDGQTVVIGGLIETEDSVRRTKVPLLGDVPLVGEVFRTRQMENVKTELMVILTPRIIGGRDAASIERTEGDSWRMIDESEAGAGIRGIMRQSPRLPDAGADANGAPGDAGDAPEEDQEDYEPEDAYIRIGPGSASDDPPADEKGERTPDARRPRSGSDDGASGGADGSQE